MLDKLKRKRFDSITERMQKTLDDACAVANTDFNALNPMQQRIAFECAAVCIHRLNKDMRTLRRAALTIERGRK